MTRRSVGKKSSVDRCRRFRRLRFEPLQDRLMLTTGFGDVTVIFESAPSAPGSIVACDMADFDGDGDLKLVDADGTTLLTLDDDGGSGAASRVRWTAHSSVRLYVVVAAPGPGLGRYHLKITDVSNDHGDGAADATSVSVPSITAGEIEVRQDIDWFVFTAEEGETYLLDMHLETLSDRIVTLVDADGTTQLAKNDRGRIWIPVDHSDEWEAIRLDGTPLFLREGDPGPTSRLQWTATSSGPLYVVVAPFGDDVGGYQLEITEVADDHGDEAAGATSVSVPSVTEGQIEVYQDVDWFVFTAEEGTSYLLETSLGTLTDRILRLVDADGTTQLAVNGDWTNNHPPSAPVMWTAESSGRLYVEVTAIASEYASRVGSYQLSISEVEDDHGHNADSATEVSVPSTTDGEMLTYTDADWFVFSAAEGTKYVIESNRPSIQLLDTDGQTVLAEDDRWGHLRGTWRWHDPQLAWRADSSRSVFVKVLDEIGPYQLKIAELPDDHGDDRTSATAVTVPSTTGGVTGIGVDVDWFVFSAQEGKWYLVESSLADSDLRLLDADGMTELAHAYGETDARPQVLRRAGSSGDLYVELTGFPSGQDDHYELQVAEFTDDHGNTPADATLLAVPARIPAAIDVRSDRDWLAFDAAKGTSYLVQATSRVPGVVGVRLVDSDGQSELFSATDGGGQTEVVWHAESEGTMFVEISPADSGAGGSYELRISEFQPDHGIDPDSATSVAVPSTTAGEIRAPLDADWFVFEVQEGFTYAMDVVPKTLGRPRMRLFHADGQPVVAMDDEAREWNGVPQVWLASATEDMFLEVTGADFVSYDTPLVGSYEVHVDILSDPHGDDAESATSIAVPSSTAGRLVVPTETDWFEFSATAGLAYRLNLRSTGVGDATLRLYGPDGVTRIAVGEDVGESSRSQLMWIAPVWGTHYMEVASSGGTGTYELEVEIPYGDANLDGRFDSRDLMLVLQANEYQDDIQHNSTWAEGDWNGDREFDRLDLVSALASRPFQRIAPNPRRADDYGDDAASATFVLVEPTVSGEIETAGDVDWITFSAEEDTTYLIRLWLVSLAEATVRVLDSDGITVLPTDRGVSDAGPSVLWQADSSGMVFVEVAGPPEGVGSYYLQVSRNTT